jgi:hypothetical protein
VWREHHPADHEAPQHLLRLPDMAAQQALPVAQVAVACRGALGVRQGISVCSPVLAFPLAELAEQQSLAGRASHNGISPSEQFCQDSAAAGSPDYYMSPVGLLPNPFANVQCY